MVITVDLVILLLPIYVITLTKVLLKDANNDGKGATIIALLVVLPLIQRLDYNGNENT